MRRTQNERNRGQPPKPQAWITLLWHMGLRLPWSWRLGPSNSSERAHVMELVGAGEFPSDTLFCGDAGFVGYPLWSAILRSGSRPPAARAVRALRAWQLRALTNSVGNPRQLGVRRNIRKAIVSGQIDCFEYVSWPPLHPYTTFRLRFAHMGSLNAAMLVDNTEFGLKMGDWQQAVQVLQTMRLELDALGILNFK